MVIALIFSTLSGCETGISKPVPPPDVNVQELALHGITLSDGGTSFGEVVVNADEQSDSVSFTGLDFYFSPLPEQSTNPNIASDTNRSIDFPYDYSFSAELNPGNFSALTDETGNVRYFGVMYSVSPAQFVLFGNHFLTHSQLLNPNTIPKDATHVEFWFRSDLESQRALVNRVALENLEAWNTYIQPAIGLSN